MKYLKQPDYNRFIVEMSRWASLKQEFCTKNVKSILSKVERQLKQVIKDLQSLLIDKKLCDDEPSDYAAILKLKSSGPRRIWGSLEVGSYRDKLEEAILRRLIGCSLGASVEFWSIKKCRSMQGTGIRIFHPQTIQKITLLWWYSVLR
ncbi:hypothetical protein SMSP2_00885 [Limihaloglobus sulfuriphilus]|uniref:Uncharacterized protein n=1 Tax=Limihaloglobus sulfuriphilus TaxID=1851148 RepID=A0A1Q2MCV3_9BACT|nr:hypothetical protein SMSP2_00885 [Limihaloglobus sulfuriphilus]